MYDHIYIIKQSLNKKTHLVYVFITKILPVYSQTPILMLTKSEQYAKLI